MIDQPNYKVRSLILFLLIFLFFSYPNLCSQVNVKFQTGISYQEHLSTGIGIAIHQKQEVYFLFGSNVFLKTSQFSSYFLQYQHLIVCIQRYKVNLFSGLKMGYILYTDKYYQWKLFTLIPFLEADFLIRENLSFFATGGLAVNQTLSQIRREVGEIESYRQLLPEFKFGLKLRL